MFYRRIGSSGLHISAYAFGTFNTFAVKISAHESKRILYAAYDAGVNHFDGAEAYAKGAADQLLGDIITEAGWDRGTYVLAGKAAAHGKFPEPTRVGNHRKHLRDAVDKTLRRFRTDYIDLFYCHRPDSATPLAEIVVSMNHLIQQGKILHWGTSDHSVEELRDMHEFARANSLEGPIIEQTWYNAVNPFRVDQDLAPLCQRYGMGVAGYSSLNGGYLSGKYLDGIPPGSRADVVGWGAGIGDDDEAWKRTVVSQLRDLANELGISLPALCLAWNLQCPHLACVLGGASTVEQLRGNLECIDFAERMTADIMQRMAQILARDSAPASHES